VPPLESVPESIVTPTSLMSLCNEVSVFVQVTVAPTGTVRESGLNAKLWIVTLARTGVGAGVAVGAAVGAAVGPVAGVEVAPGVCVAVGIGVGVWGAAVGCGAGVGVVLLPPPMQPKSRRDMSTNGTRAFIM